MEEKSIETKLYENGVIVALNVSTWTGKKAINPEDLGLEEKDVDKRAVQLGSKFLCSKDLRELPLRFERKARYQLQLYGQPFLVNGAYYVLYTHLPRLTEMLNDLQIEFNNAVETLLNHYESEFDRLITGYEPVIRTAYTNLKAKGLIYDFDEYRRQFVSRLWSNLPSKEEIKAKYNFDYVVFKLDAVGNNGHVSALDASLFLESRIHYQNQMRTRIDNFVITAQNAVRQALADYIKTIETKAKDEKLFSKKNATALRRLIEDVRGFDFAEDASLEGQLDDIEQTLSTIEGERILADDEVINSMIAAVKGIVAKGESTLGEIKPLDGSQRALVF